MHQPIDEQPKDPHADHLATAWCLVQEGYADFSTSSATARLKAARGHNHVGVYSFALNERGKEAHRQAHGGE